MLTEWILREALAQLKHGNLQVTTAQGNTFSFGDGTGQLVVARFVTAAAQRAAVFDPGLKLGEAYMDGTFVIEHGSIADFVDLVARTKVWPLWSTPIMALRFMIRRVKQFNLRRQSRLNVAHHYDLDGRLYALFLDGDRQYSCAYFENSQSGLDDAQLAKKRHIAAKLLLQKGHRLLDIGCGFGGFALYAAECCGANVTGITLSQEQLEVARRRSQEHHLDGRAVFHALDYRDVTGTFDRIVSVGMFEHVGIDFYNAFFAKCAQLLADDGVMALSAIGRAHGPSFTNAWVAKYIFPGGYIPSLSEVLPAIDRAGLLVTDIEILCFHYAKTIRAWREQLLAHRDEVLRMYDARFLRMWEFYLAISESAFSHQDMMVFQIQLTKDQRVVPMTRDYIMQEESRLRAIERGHGPPLRLAGE
jgi:cyclopropane-fatty-acyl-phospholipid synthase